MRRKLFFLVLLLFSFYLSAQEIPFCDISGANVLDAGSLKKKYSDKIKLLNMSEEEGIRFSVYYFSQNKWNFLGREELDYYYDSESIDTTLEGKIGEFRYFAIVSDSGKEFKYSLDVRHNDLYINIIPIDNSIDERRKTFSFIIDTSKIEGIFKDNVKFVNFSDDENISFWVYAFNNEDDEWQKIGFAHLKDFKDTDTVDTPVKKLSSFRYFAIYSVNNKNYIYDVEKTRKDLYIKVR